MCSDSWRKVAAKWLGDTRRQRVVQVLQVIYIKVVTYKLVVVMS